MERSLHDGGEGACMVEMGRRYDRGGVRVVTAGFRWRGQMAARGCASELCSSITGGRGREVRGDGCCVDGGVEEAVLTHDGGGKWLRSGMEMR